LTEKTLRKSDLQEKALHVILGAISFKLKHVVHDFCLYFQRACSHFQGFCECLQSFAQISTHFAWIFTKSKLLGLRLHPCLLHQWTN